MTRDLTGQKIDDSSLFHYSAGYDPQKAREYYLRTRQLKGRKRAASKPSGSVRPASQPPAARVRAGGKANRSNTKSRQAELKAQKEALQARLERLRDVLDELVKAAKKRSGVKEKESEKDKAPETAKDKADRNKDKKKDKPETAAEKKERAKKAKEAYEKENPTSLSQDVEILQAQVADIREKIEAALAQARKSRETRNTAGKNDSKSGSKNTNDGPRGR